MKQLSLFVGFYLLMNTFSFAQNEKALSYINKYKDAAIEEMKRSGVPASITLAQGMLESGYGESELCKKSNNHFGIKCKNEWTGDKVYHDDDYKNECFRAYPSVADSYKDHSDFLKSRPWYVSLFKLESTDYEGWAYGLKKAGYATEKDYPEKLIGIIQNYGLHKFTLIALEKKTVEITQAANARETTNSFINLLSEVKKDTVEIEKEDSVIEEKELIDSETVINQSKSLGMDTLVKKTAKYPDSIFTINHAKVIYAKEGTSLLSIADKFGLSLSNLLYFNELKEMDVLDTDRLIFVERKLKKGAKDYHIVQEKETLQEISQTEGVQLNNLLIYNKLNKSNTVKIGDKILLRPMITAETK
jgi:LysM repeat protein